MLHRLRAALGAAILIGTFVSSSIARGEPQPGASATPRASPTPASLPLEERDPLPDSPRIAVQAFLHLCRAEKYQEAAAYLDLSSPQKTRAAELAKRFKRVLDRQAPIDLTTLSPDSSGSTRDGLSPQVDEVAIVRSSSGRSEGVRLVRTTHANGSGDGIHWIFSRATVNRIDAWYDSLEHKWLFENLPPFLLKTGPRELMIWQWLALPCVGFAAWLFGMLLARASSWLLSRATRRTSAGWDDALVGQLRGPLALAWTVVVGRLTLPWLELQLQAESWIDNLLGAGLFLAIFWASIRGLGLLSARLLSSPWASEHPASRSLIPIGTRVAKVLVFALAVVALLAELGYPVASLIAGLGIGGLAVALAAQKTVENLFGAFSLGVDQPFREGDFVRIEDFVGTVETIGLRSTRIRTLDRTVVSIPNGKLAEMRLESFAERDRIRLHSKLGLVYDTTADQMRAILGDLERTLRGHPQIWPDSMTVRFEAFGESSLEIEIMAWFQTKDFDEFKLIRQTVLLQFMSIVEERGSAFAFPTRTLHLVGTENPASVQGGLQRAADSAS